MALVQVQLARLVRTDADAASARGRFSYLRLDSRESAPGPAERTPGHEAWPSNRCLPHQSTRKRKSIDGLDALGTPRRAASQAQVAGYNQDRRAMV